MDRDLHRPLNSMTTKAAADPEPPMDYLDHFGLSKPPFGGMSENAGYILFGSQRRAFEVLTDHIANGSGMVLLLGEAGIGKTRILRAVAGETDLRTILLCRPPDGRITREQLVSALDDDPKGFHQPPRKVLLVDDIGLMTPDCASLLTSIVRATPDEANGSAIVLSGSAAESERADLSVLVDLARTTIRMSRLGPAEILQYVERSLWIAGGTTHRLITPNAMKLLVAGSGGLPGTLNRLMEAAFTAGFARGDARITARTVAAATGPAASRRRTRSGVIAARAFQIGAIGLLITGVSVFFYKGLRESPSPVAVPAPAPASKPAAFRAPAASEAQTAATLPPELLAALMKRGNQSLALGDIEAARLLFRRAADAGDARAATALGRTYDPKFAAMAGDPVRAMAWYRKAITLGDPAAVGLLTQLAGR